MVSIVGRFLQHSRIYYFRNGGDEEYYIGSADCMGRNLGARVEALVPVEDVALRAELQTGAGHPACGPPMRLGDVGGRQLHAADPAGKPRETGTFQSMIAWAHAREFEGTRLRNRRAVPGCSSAGSRR